MWCRVFGDSPEYVDETYRIFGDDITGYAVVDAGIAESSDGSDFKGSVLSAAGDVKGHKDSASVPGPMGKVCAALTCYKCGELTIPDFEMNEICGKPVYVSYAVCTDPEYRGQGLGGILTEYVRDIVVRDLKGLSLVSPAEVSLEDFYLEHGYRPFFYVDDVAAAADMNMFEDDDPFSFDSDEPLPGELWADEESAPFEPELSVRELAPAEYSRYREAFLAEDPHVVFTDRMMDLVAADSLDCHGLLLINGGDAICAVSYIIGNGCNSVELIGGNSSDNVQSKNVSSGNSSLNDGTARRLVVTELLVNPMLLEISAEIDSEIASRLAKHFGAEFTFYKRPGMRKCQSMLAGSIAETEAEMPQGAYYGFPID